MVPRYTRVLETQVQCLIKPSLQKVGTTFHCVKERAAVTRRQSCADGPINDEASRSTCSSLSFRWRLPTHHVYERPSLSGGPNWMKLETTDRN